MFGLKKMSLLMAVVNMVGIQYANAGEPQINCNLNSVDCVFNDAAPCNIDECNNDCCDSGGFRVFAGAEAVFLNPNFKGDASAVMVNGVETRSRNLSGFYASPRVWAGVHFGDSPYFAQVRYWELEAHEGSTVESLAFASSAMELRTFDFELGRNFFMDDCDRHMAITFGGRYSDYETTDSVAASEFNGQTISSAFANSINQFDGTGLTMSFLASRRIGCSDWHLFFSTRHSFVFGDVQAGAFTQASSTSATSGAYSINGAINGPSDTTLYTGEFQFGTEWRKELACVPAEAFLRLAIEWQIWDANNNGRAGSASFADVIDNGTLVGSSAAVANSGPLAVNLFGFSVGAGVNW